MKWTRVDNENKEILDPLQPGSSSTITGFSVESNQLQLKKNKEFTN